MSQLITVILSFYDSLLENMNGEEIIDFIESIIRNKKIIKDLIKEEINFDIIYD